MSAHDIERNKRYYFTNNLTPVRVYINYYANITEEDNNEKKINFPRPPTTYAKYNTGISKKFQQEVLNCQFMKETRSFIPNSAVRYLCSEKSAVPE